MDPIIIYGLIGLAALIVILLISYVKSPPSNAYIISGISKNPRILIGKGGFRVPYLERLDRVYLGQITVDIKTGSPVPTKDFINVNVDAVAKIRVSPTEENIRLASKNFLNMDSTEIANQLQDSLQGNMREIIGTIDLKALNTDRDQFSDSIAEKAAGDMEKLGIEILSCNIQEVTDETGLISDLGADNTWKIRSEAAKTKARKEAEIQIEESNSKKEANDARVAAEKEIEEKNNELEIKKLELYEQRGIKKAVSESSYQIEFQNQQRVINVQTVNAEIAKTEKEEELTKKQIILEQNRLEATVNKKADAEKYQVVKQAEGELEKKKRIAEADKYTVEQEAEAIKARALANAFSKEQDAIGKKKLAEADAFKIEAEGTANAKAIQEKGMAEAVTIKEQGLAEAEAMEKKAEAYSKYDNAAKMDMIIGILPQMAREIAAPISAIKSLNIYGSDAEGISKVSGQVPTMMKRVMDTMSDVTGVDMSRVVEASTKEAMTDKNISLETDIDITTLSGSKKK